MVGGGSSVSDGESIPGSLCRSVHCGIGKSFISWNETRCLSATMLLRIAGAGGGAGASSGDGARMGSLQSCLLCRRSAASCPSSSPVSVPLSGWSSTRWRTIYWTRRARACLTVSSFARAECTMSVGLGAHSSRDFVDAPVNSMVTFLILQRALGGGWVFCPPHNGMQSMSEVDNSPQGRGCTRPSPASRPCRCRTTGNISFHHHQPPVGGTGDANKMP
jgi:hypothetical protein